MPVIATPVITPSAADITSESQLNIIQPAFSRSYDNILKQKIRAVYIKQGVLATIQLQLYGYDSKPIELTSYGIETGSSFSLSSSSASIESTGGRVLAKFREVTDVDPTIYEADVEVFDATNGVVRVTLPPEVYTQPGIYWVEIGLLNSDDGVLFIQTIYLFVERSAWRTSTGALGPPLIDEIRLNLRDSDIYENLLIENHDFDIAELCVAIQRTVTYWNERPPAISGLTFTTKTFPFREIWMTGIQLYLFQLAEEHYRRNKLEFSAGGSVADDKKRDGEYKAAWQERYQAFNTMVMNKKSSLNVQRGFRSLRQSVTRWGL